MKTRQKDQRRKTGNQELRNDTGQAAARGPAACARCCQNCVYAMPLCEGRRKMTVCTNAQGAPGEMRIVAPGHVCRRHRRRRVMSGRTVPPEPPNDEIRYIPLTRGKYAIVDAADYEQLNRHKWCASFTGKRFYAYRKDHGRSTLMHRVLTNCPAGMVVDHIDGNGLNNRRSNLRVCTPTQNVRNCGPIRKSSKFKGVCYNKRWGQWVVWIRYDGRNIFVGRFDDEIEAARAYDRQAAVLFGEFAYLNFPHEIWLAGRTTTN